RDGHVTGVQTCALPISVEHSIVRDPGKRPGAAAVVDQEGVARRQRPRGQARPDAEVVEAPHEALEALALELVLEARPPHVAVGEIGRASCRERGWASEG